MPIFVLIQIGLIIAACDTDWNLIWYFDVFVCVCVRTLKIALANCSLLCFHMNIKVAFSRPENIHGMLWVVMDILVLICRPVKVKDFSKFVCLLFLSLMFYSYHWRDISCHWFNLSHRTQIFVAVGN